MLNRSLAAALASCNAATALARALATRCLAAASPHRCAGRGSCLSRLRDRKGGVFSERASGVGGR